MLQLQQLHANLLTSDLDDDPHNNNHWNTPFQIVRFLLEHKGNIPLAARKFRDMLAWRRQFHVDSMLLHDDGGYHPPSLFRYFPAGVLQGVDYDGDPIHCERTGAADSLGLLRRFGKDELLRHAIWIREVQTRGAWHDDYKQRQQGRAVQQFTVVLDMQGLTAQQTMTPALMALSQEVSRIVQDYYPSYAKRIIIIRAPAVFQMAFHAVKPFLDPSMRDKIIVADHHDYETVLAQYMDLSVLPPEICPSVGRGKAVRDFENVVWKGGKLPRREDQEAKKEKVGQLESFQARDDHLEPHRDLTTPTITIPSEMAVGVAAAPPSKTFSSTESDGALPSREERHHNWVERQLELFQESFSSMEGGNAVGSYTI